MTPVGGQPFLWYLLRLLKSRGAGEAILCTGYLGEQVEEYFGDGREIGLRLRYSREMGPLLDTGGALKLAEPLLNKRFLVVNGDTYLDIDYKAVFENFNKSSVQAMIVAAYCQGETGSLCDLAVNVNGTVTRYDKINRLGLDYVNAGVMALKREILSTKMPERATSLETDILPTLIDRQQVKAYIIDNKFYDIGSFAGLGIFERMIEKLNT